MVAVPLSQQVVVLFATLCVASLLACPGGELEPPISPPPIWPASDLVAVDVVDEDHVIVVAASGEIYLSSDRGLSWQRADAPAVGGLRDLSMIDPESGWAVGEGVILRTRDGGSSWTRQTLPSRADPIRLVGVSAIDHRQVIAVGENGIRLRTQDGGRVWRDVSRPSVDRAEGSGEVGSVFCDPEFKGRCWSAGAVIRRTDDYGRSWHRVAIEDFARMDPIVFGVGQVDISNQEAERLALFLSANLRRTRSEWRIEPGISLLEREQIGHRRDPDALFELIEARVQEVRSMLEEAGVPEGRVREIGAPPWNYADFLDDNPDFLDRYWKAHRASKPSVVVRIVEDLKLVSLGVSARGLALAVGAEGALIRSDDGGEHWVMAERISPHDLLAVGIGGERVVVVGAQGGIWLSQDGGIAWRGVSGLERAPFFGTFFEPLRGVAFSPGGRVGMIVGDHGRMLRSADGGSEWESLARGESG